MYLTALLNIYHVEGLLSSTYLLNNDDVRPKFEN
jgi:hypothetical protein